MAKKAALVLAIALFIVSCLPACNDEPFRLHIIANSDSIEDQSVKIKVRDEILKLANDDMKKVKTKEQAEEYIKNNLGIIEDKAEETLESYGMHYGAKAVSGRFGFPDKTYGNKTYPAGEYDALRVILGRGEGKNWWCVLYPPLCLMEIEDAEKKVLEELGDTQNVEYKSFFGELISSVFGGK